MDKKGKRINLIPVQAQQGVAADGYVPSPLRTGQEQIIAHRTTEMFASTAAQDGTVESITARAITVKYKDGSTDSRPLGRLFGTAAGVNYPHDLITTLKKGDKVKEGDTLTYNEKFFVPDPFNKGGVIFKTGVLCATAFIDDIDTLEDGSAISQEIAEKLASNTTEIRPVYLRFDQHVHDLIKVGDHVDLNTVLCTIEDPETVDNPLFNAEALEVLERVSAMTPRAKTTGVVSQIEIFYHGDYADLSPNLQALVDASDKERRLTAKALGRPVFTGQVDTSFRIKGTALDPDTVAVQISIDHHMPAGVGDKGVFSNQMKTVFSRIMHGVNETVDGMPLGGKFGNTSVEARIVNSPRLWGTTNTILIELSKHVAGVYRGTKDARRKPTKPVKSKS